MSIKQLETAATAGDDLLASLIQTAFHRATGFRCNVAVVRDKARLEARIDISTVKPSVDMQALYIFHKEMIRRELVEHNEPMEILPSKQTIRFKCEPV